MCADPDWMPFEKIQDGKHIGFTAVYMDIPMNWDKLF